VLRCHSLGIVQVLSGRVRFRLDNDICRRDATFDGWQQRLGVQLLTRTTRRIALTAEGETYYRRCQDIIAAIEAAEAEVTQAGQSLMGHIRVNASSSIARYQIARILPEFLDRHEGITVELDAADWQVDLIAARSIPEQTPHASGRIDPDV